MPQAMLCQSFGLKTHFGMRRCPNGSGKGFPSYRGKAMLCQSFGLKTHFGMGRCPNGSGKGFPSYRGKGMLSQSCGLKGAVMTGVLLCVLRTNT